jgi:hypothetical protein
MLFLGHLKGQILKDVTHKAGTLEGAQAQRPASFCCFKPGVALILWKNRSSTTGCAKTPSQSANSILEDWVTLIAIPWGSFVGRHHTNNYSKENITFHNRTRACLRLRKSRKTHATCPNIMLFLKNISRAKFHSLMILCSFFKV